MEEMDLDVRRWFQSFVFDLLRGSVPKGGTIEDLNVSKQLPQHMVDSSIAGVRDVARLR